MRTPPDHDEHGRINPGSKRASEVLDEVAAWAKKNYHPRRAEYVEWLKKWILKEHEGFLKRAKLLEGQKKLRRKDVQGELDWLWSDLIWCGDVTVGTCPEEFFGLDYPGLYDAEDKEQKYAMYSQHLSEEFNEDFDKAFRAVMPKELHHVLEG